MYIKLFKTFSSVIINKPTSVCHQVYKFQHHQVKCCSTLTQETDMILNVAEKNDAAKGLSTILSGGRSQRVSG